MWRKSFTYLGLALLCTGAISRASADSAVPEVATVNVGVLALHGKTEIRKRWQPTVDYLSARIPGYQFQVLPLSREELERAVQGGSVEFVVTNTGNYLSLEQSFGVTRLATLRNLRNGKGYSRFGAVLFTRADRRDIGSLEDLRGKSFIGVSRDSFGGFQMAWYELLKNGLDPFVDFAQVEFSGFPQEQVPLAVLKGSVDAGTVRTGVLEDMAREGKISLGEVKVINTRRAPGFPFLLSTDLYPEWPFAVLPDVDSELTRSVQLALLLMDGHSKAARASSSAGWKAAEDYSSTHKLMNHLGVGPYSDPVDEGLWGILHRYWIVLLVLAVISVPPFWYYVIRLYFNSKAAERRRKQAEAEWLQGMDLLSDLVILLDLDDRVIRANKAFYQQVGKTPDQFVGRVLTDYFHPEGEEVPCPVCQARRDLRDTVITVEADDPQNHFGRPMEISIRVVRDPERRPVRIIQSVRDLTEIRYRELMLRKENLVLEQIARGTTRVSEKDYFRELVQVVSETLDVDYTLIMEIVDPDNTGRVRVSASWGRGQYKPPLEYDLVGTPAERIFSGAQCLYEDDVQHFFPRDQMLLEADARSYLGVPFFGEAGMPLGYIAIINSQPIVDRERFLAILQIFADRVGVEFERLKSIHALEESEKRFRGLFDSAPDPTIIVNEHGNIVLANSRFRDVFGYDRNEIIGQPVEILVPEEYRSMHPKMRFAYMHHPVARDMGSRPELMAVRKDGSQFSVEISLSPVDTGEGGLVTSVIRDVGVRKQAERELERLASFPMMSPTPVMEVDLEGQVTYENPVSARLFPDLRMRGFDHPLLRDINDVLLDLRGGARSVIRDVTVDGMIYEQQLSLISETGQLRIYSWDVTNLHEMTKQMQHQATHDALTGLINRREFEQVLERSIQDAVYEDGNHVLCYIDLDQFKLVNDVCGHSAGDELLRQLTRVLKDSVRTSDHFARLGGDEFGLLYAGCPMDQARKLADKLREVIAGFEFVWEKQSFRVGASIGLVEINRSSGSLAEVLSAADSACYAAKELGRNRLFVYHPDDVVVSRTVREMNWTQRIRHALDYDEFLLYYQTIESLKSDDQHCEILLRLIDDDGQIVPPGAFIPAAERFGLMIEIDKWVVKHALDIIEKDEERFASYSINLSGQTLGDPTSMNNIVEMITESGVAPEKICFEITETAMISSFSSAEKYIRVIRGIGCQFALDDFGTGLSSFSYLKKLPVDRLKIDSHFVQDIMEDEVNATMVMSINIVGHAMNLKTVAEGVEDRQMVDLLREFDVDYVQGYAFSRPELFTGQCVPIDSKMRSTA